ncbi:hypothetical protein [Sorangium sp. So ce117]|uniref:hypothetical protein n=1 Tax=Sorangium sp. So ce117 TaxID=3133277 RepID=UPI003F609833
MAKTYRPRIPKPFRIPRRMAAQAEATRFGWLTPDVLSIVAGALIAAVAPLDRLDYVARGLTASALADAAPSAQVLLVTASPEALREGLCERSLPGLLERGRARGALLIPPADAFCGGGAAASRAGAASATSAAGAAPVVRMPPELLRLSAGDVVGFFPLAAGERAPELGALGVSAAPWVLKKAPQSVPAVSLRDLADGQVPASALEGRVAVVAVGAGGVAPQAVATSALPPARGVAAVLGGLLDGGRRASAPAWVPALFVLLAGGLVRTARRRYGSLAATAALFLGVFALAAGQGVLAARAEASLIALPSALFGLAVAFAGVMIVRGLVVQRSVDRAAELIQRAALFRMQGVHTLPDEEFWPRVARLAEQAHPADLVLVAELPAGSWHLRFWNDTQGGGESLVAELRRDVRRPPYSSEQGVPAIRLSRRFLAKQDMPAVVVPLIAFGEIEGYVFFCGPVAEQTFSREPERAEHVGRELALLLRRKRLARTAQAGAGEARGGGSPEDDLVEGARVALDDLQLFGSMLRSAPVGLLYADAFGDVRFVAPEFAKWLRARDVTVPAESASAALPPGSLTLGDVLGATSASDAAVSLSSVMASDDGIELSVTAPEPAVLSVRPLRRESDGSSWIAGYVAALIPVQQAAPVSDNVRPLAVRDAADPLCAFQLGDVVADAVASASRATGRAVRLEPIRGATHALGHRGELEQVLEAFLTDVAGRGLPGHGPVVSVREAPQGVQLSILDVGFGLGLPESALQRVLTAPGSAPAGLEPLGRLILAVEDSHGHAELKTNDGWGITLTVTLLRAHPRAFVSANEGGKPAAQQNVIAIGRAGPK